MAVDEPDKRKPAADERASSAAMASGSQQDCLPSPSHQLAQSLLFKPAREKVRLPLDQPQTLVSWWAWMRGCTAKTFME